MKEERVVEVREVVVVVVAAQEVVGL